MTVWSSDRLEADRQVAIATFRSARITEPLEQYVAAFDETLETVRALLERTADLELLAEGAAELLANPGLATAVRYLAGPPLSADDLKVIADVPSLAPGRIGANPQQARSVVSAVGAGLDRRRFPWVADNRKPSSAERDASVLATAALIASQRIQTARRSEGKTAQERAVRDALLGDGLTEVSVRAVEQLADAPAAGAFCREAMFGSRKADLVVGLWDGRKMPLECKVSNSELNSIKRLNNDAAVKAVEWVRDFGARGVTPAAVLAGVFKRSHLEYAQSRGLAIFWAHDLVQLTTYIASTRG